MAWKARRETSEVMTRWLAAREAMLPIMMVWFFFFGGGGGGFAVVSKVSVFSRRGLVDLLGVFWGFLIFGWNLAGHVINYLDDDENVR